MGTPNALGKYLRLAASGWCQHEMTAFDNIDDMLLCEVGLPYGFKMMIHITSISHGMMWELASRTLPDHFAKLTFYFTLQEDCHHIFTTSRHVHRPKAQDHHNGSIAIGRTRQTFGRNNHP